MKSGPRTKDNSMEPITYAGLTTVLIALVGWLLNDKDAKQQKEIAELQAAIKLLFKKHDDDVAALVLLQRQIDKEHYVKPELDARFQSLESTFRSGMHDLGAKFDRLSGFLVEHVTKTSSK